MRALTRSSVSMNESTICQPIAAGDLSPALLVRSPVQRNKPQGGARRARE